MRLSRIIVDKLGDNRTIFFEVDGQDFYVRVFARLFIKDSKTLEIAYSCEKVSSLDNFANPIEHVVSSTYTKQLDISSLDVSVQEYVAELRQEVQQQVGDQFTIGQAIRF